MFISDTFHTDWINCLKEKGEWYEEEKYNFIHFIIIDPIVYGDYWRIYTEGKHGSGTRLDFGLSLCIFIELCDCSIISVVNRNVFQEYIF